MYMYYNPRRFNELYKCCKVAITRNVTNFEFCLDLRSSWAMLLNDFFTFVMRGCGDYRAYSTDTNFVSGKHP